MSEVAPTAEEQVLDDEIPAAAQRAGQDSEKEREYLDHARSSER
jgi:hypothetical protein